MNREEIIAKLKEFVANPAMESPVFAKTDGVWEYYSLVIVLSGDVEALANAIIYNLENYTYYDIVSKRTVICRSVASHDIDCIAITIPSEEPFTEMEGNEILNEYKSLPGITFEERWYECVFDGDGYYAEQPI